MNAPHRFPATKADEPDRASEIEAEIEELESALGDAGIYRGARIEAEIYDLRCEMAELERRAA